MTITLCAAAIILGIKVVGNDELPQIDDEDDGIV